MSNTNIMKETETQTLLRRAKEAVAQYKDYEDEAHAAAEAAQRRTQAAREKYEALFLKNELEVAAKLKSQN